MSVLPTKTCEIVLNGEARQVPEGLNVLALLEFLHIVPDRVAVELNRQIVRHAEWPGAVVEAGSQVEIVQFVGGG
jgi:thiamine biosynthesis protein ThiS